MSRKLFVQECKMEIINKLFGERKYLDLTHYQKYHKQGFRLVRMPFKKVILTLFIIGVIGCLITPGTNFLIIVLTKFLRRYG